MQASKSREDIVEFDVYRCLTCDTTITQTRRPTPANKL
jgi:hypothetical protein